MFTCRMPLTNCWVQVNVRLRICVSPYKYVLEPVLAMLQIRHVNLWLWKVSKNNVIDRRLCSLCWWRSQNEPWLTAALRRFWSSVESAVSVFMLICLHSSHNWVSVLQFCQHLSMHFFAGNMRLQEMMGVMCKERSARLFATDER